jgi:signal transduction histidine kinase
MVNGRGKTGIPNREHLPQREDLNIRATLWLLRAKVTTGIRSRHFLIITGLFAVLIYIYYGVLATFHDVYVILFFYPLIYAAAVYRLRGVVISGLVFLAVLLPHALLISYDPLSLTRTIIFALFAFLISGLGATLLNYLEHQIEAYEEILSLNEELNSYIERLQSTQRQLIQAEKLSALGQLSAAVAHEVNNPLAGVLIYSKLLAKKIGGESFDREEALANLTKIDVAINQCSSIIRSLLDFARQSAPALGPVAISSVIDQVISLVGHQAVMKKVEVAREEASALPPVLADFNQLQQVFINLTVNAIQAMPEGGKLTIRSSPGDDGWVKVSFQDNGCGIPAENMDKLFTPFFTTKDEVKGVGLGLAVSHGIIERHGGRIEVESEVGRGSTFTVHLPVYKGGAPPVPPNQ